MSIEHTARHAADAGYRVVVPSDGTATMSEGWQAAALGYALTQIAEIATCDEITARLAPGRR
jgi:gluconolactonase